MKMQKFSGSYDSHVHAMVNPDMTCAFTILRMRFQAMTVFTVFLLNILKDCFNGTMTLIKNK